IIRLSSLGDVLLASPLIRVLRKKFPEAQIDFLVRPEYADMIRYNPHLSRIIEFDIADGFPGMWKLRQRIRHERYDAIIDIHRNMRSFFLRTALFKTPVFKVVKYQIIRFLLVRFKWNLYRRLHKRIIPVWERYIRAAAPLGIRPDGEGLELFFPDSVRTAVKSYLPDKNIPLIVIAPGARHFTKRWLPQYFAELIRGFGESIRVQVVLVGAKEDLAVTHDISRNTAKVRLLNAAGKLSVLETAAVMEEAAFVVSNDSGLMHVASALNRPQIAVFGSTVKEFGFFPSGSQAVVAENKGLYCRPCTHIGRADCPEKHFRCMKEILPAEVLRIIREKG
ncbi:MAG: glycosyltransferase family 9 protein, partial [Calditrichia bacterium]